MKGKVMTAEEKALLPCPFCGSEAKTKVHGALKDWFTIECSNVYGRCCSMTTVKSEASIDVIYERWNDRIEHYKYPDSFMEKAFENI